MDATILTAALASAETLINKTLAYDPSTRIALEQLSPQVLVVNITTPKCKIFVAPAADGIRLLGHHEGDVTTEIYGTVPALISLIKSKNMNLKDSGVQITGSTTFISDLQHILKNVDIDWEEMLSKIFGDVIGHKGADLLRGKMSWAQDRAASIQRLTSEFLTEELRILPSKPELEYFYNQVDELRLGVDRAEARANQLLTRLKNLAAQQE